MLTDKTKGELMMLCGALHDIAEKTKEQTTCKQITDVQMRLQKIIGVDGLQAAKYFLHQTINQGNYISIVRC